MLQLSRISKNKDYKGPKTVDDESSKGTKIYNNTSIVDDNSESKVIEKIVYRDKLFYKYGFFTSVFIILIEFGVIIYLIRYRK